MSNTIDLGDITGRYTELTILPVSDFRVHTVKRLNSDAVDAVMESEYSRGPTFICERLENRTGYRL